MKTLGWILFIWSILEVLILMGGEWDDATAWALLYGGMVIYYTARSLFGSDKK